MADSIFTFKVQAEPSGTVAFRTLKSQMGDGYAQMGADGINNRVMSYQIKCMGPTRVGCGTTQQIMQVKAFIDGLKGYQSFRWEPPGMGNLYRFVCEGYQWVHKGNGVYELTTTFKQVFFP